MTQTKKERRQGRGRLSSLDMLPEEAEEDLVWLAQELRANKQPQVVLLDLFNMRLAARGIEPISKSAFSRYAVRKAMQFRQIDETRRVSVELAEMLGVDSADKMTIAVSEMVKVAAIKLFEEGDVDSKSVMELARAVKDAVGAQRGSVEYRRTLEREFEQRMKVGADRAEAVAREAGLSADRIAQLRREFLGVRS